MLNVSWVCFDVFASLRVVVFSFKSANFLTDLPCEIEFYNQVFYNQILCVFSMGYILFSNLMFSIFKINIVGSIFSDAVL